MKRRQSSGEKSLLFIMAPHYVDHSSLFLTNAGECSREFEIDSQRYGVDFREAYSLYPSTNSIVCKGEERFRQFKNLVFNAFWEPKEFQIEFINLALQVLAESVVGIEDWPQVGPLLIEEYGL